MKKLRKSYEEQRVCHICRTEFITDKTDKMHLNYIIKSKIIIITLANLEELLIVLVL